MAYYTRDDIIDTLTKRVDLLGELRAHHQAKSELHRSLTNFRNDVHGTYHGHGGMGNPANHSKLLPVEAAYGAAQEYLDRRIEKLEAMMARADEEHRVACERCKEAVRRGRERGASAADGTTSDECTTDETTQDESTTA
ncbi:hypothetical protein GE09DRAFT_1220647 [Coniochaeta sp. 2T2.1]|nr:hypothetical protein GE09DRAFT_1220647 [Coniochaeta sp. 2T2.1]